MFIQNNKIENHCLVIVDMQWEFLKQIKEVRHLNLLIENIVKKINYFKKNNFPIIVLEYFLEESEDKKNLYTAHKIVKEIIDYQNVYYATKMTDSGAAEIIRSLKGEKIYQLYDVPYQNKFITKEHSPIYYNYQQWNFCLTGVNTSACVLDTAIDLYKMFNHKSYIPLFCSFDTFSNEWPYQNTILQEEYIKDVVELTV